MTTRMMEGANLLIEALAVAVEIATAFLIAFAILDALWRLAPLLFRRTPDQDSKLEVRLGLGRWLALSLEFTVAADILRTAIAPSWNDIGKLAAIAALRTALNYFLERETSHTTHHVGAHL